MNAIKAVRDRLVVSRVGLALAGAHAIAERFRFLRDLPTVCTNTQLKAEDLTFVEYVDMAFTWLKAELRSSL